MIDAVAAHPIMVQPDAEKVMRAVIASGQLIDTYEAGRVALKANNNALHEHIDSSAESIRNFQQPVSGETFATDLRDALIVGSYVAYQVISITMDGQIPNITPELLKNSLESAPKASLPSHEWHFAIHSNPFLRSILEHVNVRLLRPTLHTQNATFSGGGLVSFAINDHIASLN